MPPEPQISFSDFAIRLNGIVVDAGIDSIKKISEEVGQLVTDMYEDFFGQLYMEVGGGTEKMPSRFMGTAMGEAGAWKPLSEKWGDDKRIFGNQDPVLFYKGLTDALNASKGRLTKSGKPRKTPKKRPRKLRSKKPFDQFLKELRSSSRSNVKKLFGDIEIKYYISATGRKTPINIEQRGNIIETISRITSHGERGRIMNNFNNVSLRSDTTLFPLLKVAREFSEWYVVDQMSKRDKGNKGQWVKINSTNGYGRGNRPIRPIITPLISWYATTLLPSILRKYY